MRVLLYEWCCSGGLAGGNAAIAAEGRMMLEAIAADAAKAAHLEITVLVDAAISITLPPSARTVTVPPGVDSAALVVAAQDADWTLIVAPETDGILLDRVQRVRAAGGRVLAPSDQVIAITSSKQATVDTLAARGIAVPAGRTLVAGEAIPVGFHMPAIRKAVASCGCDDVLAVRGHTPPLAPSDAPSRLEAFIPGTPVGVSLLCDQRGAIPLPVMQQRFSPGDAPRYLGSELLRDLAAAERAADLALRAALAVGADAGWLGVDMILGHRADGRDDRVLELNPRLTTSIVGLTSLFASSLVMAMIDVANGRSPSLERTEIAGHSAGSFRLPDR
jgi:predicted ATP-grasp superfamily ATP-dependent carboligase